MKGFFALPRQIKLGELLRFVSIQLLVILRIQLPVHLSTIGRTSVCSF